MDIESYYEEYRDFVFRVSFWIRVFCTIMTLVGVVVVLAWCMAGTLGFLAAGLVLLQIIQLLFCFPMQRQIDAMNNVLPELSDLSSKADAIWLESEYVRRSAEEENMWGMEQINFLRDRLNEIELQYINGIQ